MAGRAASRRLWPQMALLLAPGEALAAQRMSTWLEAGAGETRWSTAAATAGRVRYAMLGARAQLVPHGMAVLRGRVGFGRGADAVGPLGWWSADGGGTVEARSGGVRVRFATEAWGIGYTQEVRYVAAGLRLAPAVTWETGRLLLRGRAEGLAGRWRLETLERTGPPFPVPAPVPAGDPMLVRRQGRLTLAGGGVDLLGSAGPTWVRISSTAYYGSNRSPATWQGTIEGEVGLWRGRSTITGGVGWFSLRAHDSGPRGGAFGLRVRAHVPVTATWAIVANADTRPWDPLHGVLNGGAVQLGVEWRLLSRPGLPVPVAVPGIWTGTGRVVRFRLRAPDSARVDLVGSFTEWQPVTMRRVAGLWQVELVVPTGTHQFGFLVDGTWTLPTGAGGTVDDGWNRRNATLVVEGPEP